MRLNHAAGLLVGGLLGCRIHYTTLHTYWLLKSSMAFVSFFNWAIASGSVKSIAGGSGSGRRLLFGFLFSSLSHFS